MDSVGFAQRIRDEHSAKPVRLTCRRVRRNAEWVARNASRMAEDLKVKV